MSTSSTDLVPVQQSDSSAFMQVFAKVALSRDADIAKLRELYAMKKEYEADEARKAYAAAMSAFRAELPEVKKTKHVHFTTQGGEDVDYDHATLYDITRAISPAMARNGLNYSWNVEQTGNLIRVTCTVTHSMGHKESVTMESGPDTSGKKNAIQQIASATSYLERYTLTAITGMAAQDQDDDGRGFSNGDLAEQCEFIANARNTDEVISLYKLYAGPAFESGNKTALKALVNARDKRMKELTPNANR